MLTEQVEELTSGAVSGKAMGYSLSLGVALSLGLGDDTCADRDLDPVVSGPGVCDWHSHLAVIRAEDIHGDRL